ncbi:MAG: hypothetical protein ACLFSQ_03995 [Candidatus Zixiibacteriota bacterium]
MNEYAREARLEDKQAESEKNEAMVATIRALQLKSHAAYEEICGTRPNGIFRKFVWRK